MIHPPALHWHTTPFKVMMIGRRGSAALCRLNNASNFAECSRYATARRSFCISHTHAKAASSVQQQQAPTSTSKSSASSSSSTAIQDTSSCPAGTVLTGLNIYKDRADPVALPDKEYPAWLWTLLSDGNTSAEGAQLESTEGMTKGEARAAEKRNLRAIRAAFRAKERLAAQQQRTSTENVGQKHVAGAGAGMHAAGKPSEGIVAGAPGLAEAQQAEAAGTVADAAALDADKKRQLRKANREAIKAKNFVKAS